MLATGATSTSGAITEISTHRIPGLVLTDDRFAVPLDYAEPDSATIDVRARAVASPTAPADLPWLVFFQGGPGFASPRPTAAMAVH